MIEVERLRKSFDSLVAVDDVSFSLAEGEIFGLLGPNGAGKTTTISMVCGVLKPDGGRVVIGGTDIWLEPKKVKQNLDGKAHVCKNPGNGEDTWNGLDKMDEWLKLQRYLLNGQAYL